MAKTKAELQIENKSLKEVSTARGEKIKNLENSLRESNNTIIDLEEMNQGYKNRIEEVNVSYDRLSDFNAKLKISSDKVLVELRKSKSANASLRNKIDANTKSYESIYNAHVKLGEALREAKDQLKVQEEMTVEMVKQFDNVLMERHEKIKSLKSQNNNLRQTLKDLL